MKLAILSSACLCLAWAPPAVAAPDTAPARVPFTLRANKVQFPVSLDGTRDLRIVLDTGMGWEGLLMYDAALLDSATLRRAAQARIGGAGAGPPSTARVADSMSFRVGGARFPGQRVVALENSPMREGPADGVCGYSLFAHHVVELDYGRMEMVLHPPGTFRPGAAWTAVPLRLGANRIPWLDVAAGLSGADSVALACYVDLASSESLELLEREGAKFSTPDGLEEAVLGIGLSGEIRGRRGPIPWVRLGAARLGDVTATFTPAAVRSKQPGADAVVGNGLLGRFDCAFDYAAGRLWLRPRAGSGAER